MDLLTFKPEDDEQFSKREERAYKEDDPCKHQIHYLLDCMYHAQKRYPDYTWRCKDDMTDLVYCMQDNQAHYESKRRQERRDRAFQTQMQSGNSMAFAAEQAKS
jgi:hypothetical protein